jgi:hypothetical protein
MMSIQVILTWHLKIVDIHASKHLFYIRHSSIEFILWSQIVKTQFFLICFMKVFLNPSCNKIVFVMI